MDPSHRANSSSASTPTASTSGAGGGQRRDDRPIPHLRSSVASASSSSSGSIARASASALSTLVGLGVSPVSTPSASPSGSASPSPPSSHPRRGAAALGGSQDVGAPTHSVDMSFLNEASSHHRQQQQQQQQQHISLPQNSTSGHFSVPISSAASSSAVRPATLSGRSLDVESGNVDVSGVAAMADSSEHQAYPAPHPALPDNNNQPGYNLGAHPRSRTQQQQQQQHHHHNQQQAPPHRQNNENSDWADETSFSSMLSHLLEHNPELREIANAMEKYIKFFLLLFAKLMFDHGTGIITFGGLLLTFYNANSVVKQQVARQGRRNSLALLAILMNLVACIGFICYMFSDDKIYNSAIFLPPTKVESLYDLLWLVAVNDFMLKFVAVILKIGLIFLPEKLLPYQKRGKHFLFIERTSQLHRELVPIQMWLVYLLNGYERIPGKVMGVILVAVYMVFKGRSLIARGKAFKTACEKLMQSRSFGRPPSPDQLKTFGSGGSCPICYDNFTNPTLLHCKHIFCEECLVTWFDREKTCPMCRAQVTDDPEWRDGATSFFIQLY